LFTQLETQEKIFQLYIQKLSGHLSPEEEAHVKKMLAQDAGFRDTWNALEEQDRSIQATDYLQGLEPEAALHQLKSKRSARTRRLRIMSAAAAVLILVSAGAYFMFPAQKTTLAELVEKNKRTVSLITANGQSVALTQDSAAKTIQLNNAVLNAGNGTLAYNSRDTTENTLMVPPGETYKLILSDGTEVHLNASTSLRFPFHFGKTTRDVYVDGEAYFKVAKDATHPFVVHLPQSSVTVLGTSFNVNTYDATQEKTSLVEGKVLLQNQWELKPGMQGIVAAGKTYSTHEFDEEEVLSWMKGVYYFHKMPLAELTVIASRFYVVKFIPDNNKFAGIAVTGLMDRDKLSEFLTDLKTTANADFHFEQQTILLK
jgi:ferric-dicitrate binding protein FerR (iron transport regulator)